MKLKTMLYGLTLMLGCFVLASCVNDEEGPCLPDGKTQVLFSLVLQDNAQTRAGTETWNSYKPSETGVAYDNYINLAGVQMLLFNAGDGTYAGKLGSMTYSKSGENTYKYIGTAPTGLRAGEYKFVVLANCASITSISNITDLNTTPFNLFADSGNTEYIPMWGILKTNLTLVAGNRQELGTISLLRAMSKVTVKLEAKEGATGDPLRGYSLQKATLSNYNKSGYIVPTGASTAATTKELNLDASLNVNAADPGTNREFPAASGAKELTFYLAEYKNIGTATEPATLATLTVSLTKTVGEGQSAKTVTFEAPIQFCDYYTSGDNQGKPDTTKPYNIIRNHWYQFNIYSVTDAGALFVNPTIKDWTNVPLSYTINATTSMRLFDSWLYRYDTVDQDYTNWTNWAGSHMVVSSGRVTEATATETIIGRPLRSPQIQLLTTGLTSSVTDAFELYVDNSDFEIVRAVKNSAGAVTGYDYSGADGKLAIAGGTGVYTYFYIVPKVGVTLTKPVAHVFLYFNDPILGPQEMTYNYNALPGYSDDSSEIWAYYFSESEYDAGKTSDNKEFLKMYYKDEYNPLVPVNP